MKKLFGGKSLGERSMLERLLGRRVIGATLKQKLFGQTGTRQRLGRVKALLALSLTITALAGGLLVQTLKNNQATAYGQYEFVTRWTDLPAGEFEIELHAGDNKFFIDWGDGAGYGSTPQWNVIKISHNYATAGTRDIKIKLINNESWRFRGWTLYNNPKAQYLTEVLNWGDIEFLSMERMFYHARNLKRLPDRAPNTSKVTTMQEMFTGALRLNHDLSQFDFSGLRNDNGINGPLVGFASLTSLSTENYDKLLQKWRAQLADHVPQWPYSHRLTYCHAEAEHEFLKNKGWWFSDDSKDCRQPFVTRWTNLPAGELKIKLNGPKNTFKINWGDGTIEIKSNVTEISHTYSQKDTYDVSIFASVSEFYGWTLENNPKAKYLTSVEQWGSSNFMDMSYMFADAIGLISIPSTGIQSLTVRSMSHMFARARSFNQPVNFRTDNVTDMSGMFMGAKAFNQPINFITRSVTDMSAMFMHATAFNKPINFSDTSKVTLMNSMFYNATAFNQPLNFNTENVTDACSMFSLAKSFNQPLNFNTSNMIRISNMFDGATAFDQDISNFDFENGPANISDFVSNSNLSVENYDKLLKKWHTQFKDKPIRRYPRSTGLKYCAAETEHDYLKNVKDWDFKDTRDCSGLNLPPADITLSTDQVDENNAPNFELADITITNAPDDIPSDTNTPSLTCETAGTDDASFQITGNKLIFKPVADFETKNSYALCIRATDAGGLTKDKNFTINVKDINEAPTISGTPESTVNAGVAYSFTPTVTDPDTTAPNNTLTFEIENKPSWLNFDSSNGTLSGTPSHSDVGTYNNIKLRVKDGGTPVLSAELPEFNITVNSVNRAPVITSTPVLTATKGEQYSYTITATDEDNDPLTLTATLKPTWLNFDASTGVLSGTPGNNEAGNDYPVTLTVSDGTVTVEQSFTIHVNDKNYAPIISDQTFSIAENSANGTELGQIVATDPDAGQTLTYRIVSGNDLNIFEITNDGKLKIKDNTNLDFETHQTVTLRVQVSDDSSPVLSAEADITINITDVNEAPTISGTPATSVNQGEAYSFTPTASDPDTTTPNNTLTFAIENKPSWANFDTATGTLTGTPANQHVGSYNNITIRVTDGNGLTATLPAFNITVNDVNDAPTIANQTFSIPENTANSTELGQVVASDPDAGQALTYEITSGNDLNIFEITNDGKLKVKDNTNLDYEQHQSVTLRVKVTDNGTPALNAQANIIINITDVNEAPSFTSSTTVMMAHNQVVNHTLSATDPEGNALTYSADGLPAWINLTDNVLFFTPTFAQIGNHDIVVKVSDGTNQVTQTIHVTVREANVAPVIANQTFTVAENSINGTLVGQVVATDANATDQLNFTIVGGNDLNIFEITTDGKLKVKNNTNLDFETHTSVTLRVRVTDNGLPAMSAEADVTVNITDVDDEAPTITVEGGTAPREIMVGEAFSAPGATCHDNQGNCTLTIANPVDPAVAGDYQLTYTAIDEAGNRTVIIIPVKVKSPTPPSQPGNQGGQTGNQGNQGGTGGQTGDSTNSGNTSSNSDNNSDTGSNSTTTPTVPIDDTKPSFTINGESEMVIDQDGNYIEPGITCATGAGCSVEIIGKVNPKVPGVYTITYKSTDANGKVTTITRKVRVRGTNEVNSANKVEEKAFGEKIKTVFSKYLFWWWWPIPLFVAYGIYYRWKKYRDDNPFIDSNRPKF